MKVIFTRGLPGCGKSTWAKDYVENNKGWVRVNRDDLRNMRGAYWIPSQEDMISYWEQQAIYHALAAGYNVVVDATNFNEKYVNSIKKSIESFKPDYEFKDFDTSPEECIRRDLKRPNSVGAEVIWGMYYKYVNPPQVYKENTSLPHCVVCDIDGTLAKMNGRGPFDWARVGEDDVIEPVAELVRTLSMSRTIILMSGRDSSCAEETTDWLVRNNIPFSKLLMRSEGSFAKDSIVKSKLFENNIRGKYYVDFIIDDRKQVKRMWVSKGLFVLDVNQNDKEF